MIPAIVIGLICNYFVGAGVPGGLALTVGLGGLLLGYRIEDRQAARNGD